MEKIKITKILREFTRIPRNSNLSSNGGDYYEYNLRYISAEGKVILEKFGSSFEGDYCPLCGVYYRHEECLEKYYSIRNKLDVPDDVEEVVVYAKDCVNYDPE